MVHPQVVDRGTAYNIEGGCEYRISRPININNIAIWAQYKCDYVNTLWTGDADLHLYITTVQDG